MKFHSRSLIALLAILVWLAPVSNAAVAPEPPRLEVAADFGWKFILGDPTGAEATTFSDAAWRKVDLPHDWSIESRPDKDNPSGPGGGFFPGSS